VGTCGGVIADSMGLGKSLMTLSLVLAHPPPTGWAVAALNAHTAPIDGDAVPIKTTLLVAPATLLPQWGDEIKKHLHQGALRWGIYTPTAHLLGTDAVEAEELAEEGGPSRRSRRVKQRTAGTDAGKGGKEPQQRAIQPIMCQLGDGADVSDGQGHAPLHELDLVLCLSLSYKV
jgi:SNF2-related domain